jgi:hypothetical protein
MRDRERIQRKSKDVSVDSSGSFGVMQMSESPSSSGPSFCGPTFARSVNHIPIHAPSNVAVQRDAMPEEEEAVQMMRDPAGSMVQRDTMPEEEEAVQMMPDPSFVQRDAMLEDDQEMPVQSLSDSSAAPSSEASVSSRIQGKLGGGQELDAGARDFLEPRFGHSFENVRIHADGEADGLSKDLGARAFTTGQDIFFRSGEYQPASSGGQQLLAHELTHTIQQARGPVDGVDSGDGVRVSDPNDGFEQEAESVASQILEPKTLGTQKASDTTHRNMQIPGFDMTTKDSQKAKNIQRKKKAKTSETVIPEESVGRDSLKSLTAVQGRANERILGLENHFNEALKSFSDYATTQVGRLNGDLSDYWSILPTMIGATGAVLSVLFPPATVAVAIVVGVQAAAQTAITTEFKDESKSLKENAQDSLNIFIQANSDGFSNGTAEMQKSLRDEIEKKYANDDMARDLIEKGDDRSVDQVVDILKIPDRNKIKFKQEVLSKLIEGFSSWIAKQMFYIDHSVGTDRMLIDVEGSDQQIEYQKTKEKEEKKARKKLLKK